jgi:hypothetical protein
MCGPQAGKGPWEQENNLEFADFSGGFSLRTYRESTPQEHGITGIINLHS